MLTLVSYHKQEQKTHRFIVTITVNLC